MFNVMFKNGKEWVKAYRMPGSKPGALPFERRDYSFIEGYGPWGNPADMMDVIITSGMLVQGVAFVDPIDSPAEIIYIETEKYIKDNEQTISEVI